ncbi:MAG: SDR family oxidoreductase [Alphaproteobacteria bacterium]|nr:SDR family oxidoreductase [Alphaproteobacteria bacterium]MBU0796577.1 SDR family oxidoreductase [Alphaproteobacteria bacterium]MBU0886354.1 SDR family oxidoreductase [Alphaproteobacteria bacterium]MBU1813450.1 SDR family oxidoreductase [Alphaproteobacteria bacterium]MBU2090240.1 SDR family oxidoreductase [Alphaproteobacteria bacterium]
MSIDPNGATGAAALSAETGAGDTALRPLMAGKRGLIMGVANDHSIAWGIARSLAAHGAELAFTYQGDSFARRVAPLAESVGSDLLLSCDVGSDESIDAAFEGLTKRWDRLDFVIHAIAYSDKSELKGRYLDTSRDNFRRTLDISCFSFTNVAKRAAPLMTNGGSLLTLSYLGAERVTPNYNVMGVAKAALEASVRYLAVDLGDQNIRVNAISAGPMRTLAGSAISDARYVYRFTQTNSALRRNVTLDEIGGAGLYLMSDLSSGVTGEVLYVDSGFNVTAIPHPNREPVEEE